MRSKTKRRIAALAASAVLCVAGLGVGAGTASAQPPFACDTPGAFVVFPSDAASAVATAFAAVEARTDAPPLVCVTGEREF